MTACHPIDPGQVALGIVAGLLETRTGQKLTADRAWRVGTALSGIMRRYELETLEQLVERLGTPGYATLAQQVVEALLNNETYFFRDRAMFDVLAAKVLPYLQAQRAEPANPRTCTRGLPSRPVPIERQSGRHQSESCD